MCCVCNFCVKKNFTLHCTFDRIHRPAFELTCIFSSTETHFTHTHSTHAIERTYVRSIACVLSPHVTFLGHFPPFPLHFYSLNSRRPSLHLRPNTSPHHHSRSHHPITTTAPPRRRPSPPSPSISLPISPPFPHFPLSHTKPNFPKKFTFCPHSLSFTRTNHENGLCVSFLCWFLLLLGVGLGFKEVLQTLVLGVPTKCLIKGPNEFPACLEGELHLLGPLGPTP